MRIPSVFYDQTARPPADGTVYYHLTVVPSQVSESSVANKFNPLWNKYKSILDSRLSKFIEFQGNLEAVKMTAEQSDHPDHWHKLLTGFLVLLTIQKVQVLNL